MPKEKLLLTILNNFLNSKTGVERYGWIGTYHWSQFYIHQSLRLLSQTKDNITFLQLLVNLYSRQIDNRHDRNLLKHIVFEVFVRLSNETSLFPTEGEYTEGQFHKMIMQNRVCQERFGWLRQVENMSRLVVEPEWIKEVQIRQKRIQYIPIKLEPKEQTLQLVYQDYLASVKEFIQYGKQQTRQIVQYIEKILNKKIHIVNPCVFYTFDKIIFNQRLNFAVQKILDINKVAITYKLITNNDLEKFENIQNQSESPLIFVLQNNILKGGIFHQDTGIITKPTSNQLDSPLPPILLTVIRTEDSKPEKQAPGITIINEITRAGHKNQRIVGEINIEILPEEEEFWKINPLIIHTQL